MNAGQLKYFAPVAELPGFVRAAARTLGEIRLAGISAEMLQGIGASGLDSAELLKNYEQQLAEASLADRAEIFRTATKAVLAGETRFVGLPLLLLDLAIEWTCEREFVRALLAAAPEALVTIPAGVPQIKIRINEGTTVSIFDLPHRAFTTAPKHSSISYSWPLYLTQVAVRGGSGMGRSGLSTRSNVLNTSKVLSSSLWAISSM